MKSRLLRTLIALAIVATLPACASASANDKGDPNDSNVSSNGLIDVRLGLLTFSNTIPVYLGIEKGIFRAEGINLKLQEVQTGPALVAAAVSGDVDVSMANSVTVLQALSKGMDLTIVAPTAYARLATPEDGGEAIYVAKDSEITEPADLRGKKIGIISIGNVVDLAIKASLEHIYGLKPDAYELVGIPAGDTLNAIETGRLDAGKLTEPYATQARQRGLRLLFDSNRAFGLPEHDFPVSVWVTSDETASSKTDVIDRFKRAIEKANTYAEANPDEAKRILTEVTAVSSDIADDLTLPKFKPELSAEGLDIAVQRMLEYGFIDEPVEFEHRIYGK